VREQQEALTNSAPSAQKKIGVCSHIMLPSSFPSKSLHPAAGETARHIVGGVRVAGKFA